MTNEGELNITPHEAELLLTGLSFVRAELLLLRDSSPPEHSFKDVDDLREKIKQAFAVKA